MCPLPKKVARQHREVVNSPLEYSEPACLIFCAARCREPAVAEGMDKMNSRGPFQPPAILRLCKQSWPVTTLILEACFGLYFESIFLFQ